MCANLVPSLNDYRGNQLIGFYVAAISLAYLAVAMRLASQKISGVKVGLDDYLVIVALVRLFPGHNLRVTFSPLLGTSHGEVGVCHDISC